MRTDLDKQTRKLVQTIALNLRSFRLSKGLTQQDMEDHGFNLRWYQRFESGEHVPTLPTLLKLSKALEVDMCDFFQ